MGKCSQNLTARVPTDVERAVVGKKLGIGEGAARRAALASAKTC